MTSKTQEPARISVRETVAFFLYPLWLWLIRREQLPGELWRPNLVAPVTIAATDRRHLLAGVTAAGMA